MALWDISPQSYWSTGFLNTVKSQFLAPTTHLSIYWPVIQQAIHAWTQQKILLVALTKMMQRKDEFSQNPSQDRFKHRLKKKQKIQKL